MSVTWDGFICERSSNGYTGVRVQQRGVVNSSHMDSYGHENKGCQATLGYKTQQVKRTTGDCPGKLITSVKVVDGQFDGTV